MIGKHENKICPTCGGDLATGLATVPFIFEETVVVVKSVPAEICSNCYEPFLNGMVTDQVMALLTQLKQLNSEVSVVAYTEAVMV
ncbi:MAG: YgiT-type zinc finger protein [Aquificales bacterium]|nr:YgiT-type zinc finger protein [Aquificales bacterium]